MTQQKQPDKPHVDGRLLRGEKRREVILSAAVDVFGEQGFRGASLRELSQRIGISEPGILHHFGSKAGLLAAVIAERDRRDAEERLRYQKQGVPFADQLRKQVEKNAQYPGLTGLHVVISAEATDDSHPAHDMIVERYRDIRHQDDEAFEQLQEQGALSPKADPHSIGQIISAVMDGLQLQWLLDPSNVDMPALFDQFLRLLDMEPDK